MKKSIFVAAGILAVVFGLVSCDNELSPLGEDFLGVDPNGVIQETSYDVKTYSVPINPVQTNQFDSYPLGTYTDPVYGNSTYSFAVQLRSNVSNPQIGEGSIIKEATMEIPYFARRIPETIAGEIYAIDSLYVENDETVQIDVYRNNYFLNSFDSQDVSEPAIYYSDFEADVDNISDELLFSIENFLPLPREIEISEFNEETQETEVVERKSPRIYVETPIDVWKDLFFITNANGDIVGARPELSNNSSFQNYFRGLYFDVSNVQGEGNLVHLDLDNAFVNLVIGVPDSFDVDGDGDTTELIDSSFRFSFTGNRVGFIEHNFPAAIVSDIQTSNAAQATPEGAENLYLKGGPGSLAVVELFGQATSDSNPEALELSELIENDWLINEASIEFFVNQSIVAPGEKEPERILIYNYEDNRLLADYDIGGGRSGVNSNLSHLGRLVREESGDIGTAGVKYKIILTQHLNNIVRGLAENDRLAIVVSQDVSLIANAAVKDGNPDLEFIPESAAISHEGTVIYGSNAADPALRPRLKVFYSETQTN